jgi:hypothetical protein
MLRSISQYQEFRQALLNASRLFPQLHQSIDEDWHRASGQMTCRYCGLLYRQHAKEEIYNTDHRLCSGTVVHL